MCKSNSLRDILLDVYGARSAIIAREEFRIYRHNQASTYKKMHRCGSGENVVFVDKLPHGMKSGMLSRDGVTCILKSDYMDSVALTVARSELAKARRAREIVWRRLPDDLQDQLPR